MSNRIIFNEIFCKNFRSVDNMGIRLRLDEHPTTLIGSQSNGSGKSTIIIYALYFSLFGKSYKKDDKIGSLVNSRSNKELVVELTFHTKGSSWLIRRGYKPAIMELLKDGEPISPEAAKNDFQKYLETEVLGFDSTTFENMVILGKSRFVPFVQMKAADRRSYVEMMLDLTVFSAMSDNAKDRIKTIKRTIEQYQYDERTLNTKIQAQDKIILNLQSTIEQKNSQVDGEIEKLREDNANCQRVKGQLEEKRSKLMEERVAIGYNAEMHKKLQNLLAQANTQLSSAINELHRISSMCACHACGQEISEAKRQEMSAISAATKEKLEAGIPAMQEKQKEFEEKFSKHQEYTNKINELDQSTIKLKTRMEGNDRQILSYQKMKESGDEELKLKEELLQKEALIEELSVIGSKLEYEEKQLTDHTHLVNMLKDDGIKADIIKNYIPFLNKKINEYLTAMEFYIQLSIDSEFNIELNSPNRKNQTIASLSEGQCSMLDLSVLFAWRDIAKSKATCDCNLLVLDEILDRMSQSTVENFMSMIEEKVLNKDANLFVIDQRFDLFSGYFDNVIEVTLKDERTVIVQ